MRYYKLNEAELQKELETDFEMGLSDKESSERFKECGYNTTYSKPAISFKSLNIVFLVVSSIIAVIYLVAGVFNLKNGFDYFFLAIASALIFILSQVAVCIFDYLIDREMYFSSVEKSDTLVVLRNGEKIRVRHSEIVYGDIVYLNKGDYIPFDGIIISSNGLVTDESELSGSDRSSKHSGIITDDNITISNLFNSVFCGSFVIHGKAKVVVTDVCSRVYLVKSGKKNSHKTKYSFKNVDVSTLIIAVLSVICSVIAVVCGIISKQYVGIVTFVVFFIAVAVSGFIKVFAKHSFKKSFLNLKKKNIFLNSFTELDTLSKANILLAEHDMIFDDKIEISGFLTETMERKNVLDIGKNNFSTFLYAAFCLDEGSSVFKSCCKVLKKVGIDFSEVSALCPLLAKTIRCNNGVKVCARAYSGNNLLIAMGNYEQLKSICIDPRADEKVSALASESTETIAVAIKKVDVLSDDLSQHLSDFSIVGVIGINRNLSLDIAAKVDKMNRLGVHTVVLFPGNEHAAFTTFGKTKKIISADSFMTLPSKQISEIDIVCNYSGDKTEIVSHISSVGLLPAYFGDKILRDKKCISFKSSTLNRYETKDADVICPYGFSAVYNVFGESKKATHLIGYSFRTVSLFLVFISICGLLFSILFKENMFSTVCSSLLMFLVLPIMLYFKLYAGLSDNESIFYGSGEQVVPKRSAVFIALSAVLFLVVLAIMRLFVPAKTAATFLIIAFVTYAFFPVFDIIKHPIRCIATLIAPVIVSVLFTLPFSFVFGNVGGGFFTPVLSVLLGVILKIIIMFLCRSVKN